MKKKLIFVASFLAAGCSSSQPIPPEVLQQADKICESLHQAGVTLDSTFIVAGHSCNYSAATAKCDCK